MNTTTTATETTPSIDALLEMVDLPSAEQAAKSDADLPLDVRLAAEKASKRAYGLALADDKSREEALAAAGAAYEAEAERLLLARAEKPTARPEAPAQPAARRVALERAARQEAAPAAAGGTVDAVSAERVTVDAEAARAAGFALGEPLFTRGTRVIGIGVENARISRLQHDEKPTVAECCADLVAQVQAERRTMVRTMVTDIGMTPGGLLRFVDADLDVPRTLPITQTAFKGLVGRLGYSGGQYLSENCGPDLRAMNVNHHRERLLADEAARLGKGGSRREIALRVRDVAGAEGPLSKEIFAAVTPTYTPFDVDKVAEAVSRSSEGSGARGTVTYDGEKARFEVMFHSDVKPEHYAAGEVFKAGVVIRSNDTGDGSIRGSSVVWMNRCLNLIVIDRCAQDLFRIRHVGNVDELAKKFRDGFASAMKSLEHFRAAWGYACEERLVARAESTGVSVPAKDEAALPGFLNGVLEEGLITIPGRLKREDVIKRLVEHWEWDGSGAKKFGLTRASIANAFTRFAHQDLSAADPWAEDEIQRQAGALLWARRGTSAPAPLPYVEVEEKAAPAKRAR